VPVNLEFHGDGMLSASYDIAYATHIAKAHFAPFGVFKLCFRDVRLYFGRKLS